MIVVSNTSPLNYLVLIQAAHVLPQLYGEVYAPPEVIAELNDEGAPPCVRQWLQNRPLWLKVRSSSRIDPAWSLDEGEAHAIALAKELRADRLLIDERRGRQI